MDVESNNFDLKSTYNASVVISTGEDLSASSTTSMAKQWNSDSTAAKSILSKITEKNKVLQTSNADIESTLHSDAANMTDFGTNTMPSISMQALADPSNSIPMVGATPSCAIVSEEGLSEAVCETTFINDCTNLINISEQKNVSIGSCNTTNQGKKEAKVTLDVDNLGSVQSNDADVTPLLSIKSADTGSHELVKDEDCNHSIPVVPVKTKDTVVSENSSAKSKVDTASSVHTSCIVIQNNNALQEEKSLPSQSNEIVIPQDKLCNGDQLLDWFEETMSTLNEEQSELKPIQKSTINDSTFVISNSANSYLSPKSTNIEVSDISEEVESYPVVVSQGRKGGFPQ